MKNKKLKKIELEEIPVVLENIITIINKDVLDLMQKEEISSQDRKDLIGYATVLQTVFKDYRTQILEIKKDLKEMSKDQILSIVKSEAK